MVCNPAVLAANPLLIKYYRNIAQISQKAMGDIGLNTSRYETGLSPLPVDLADRLVQLFNGIVSALILEAGVDPYRHLEMAYSNLGDSLGGAWRNEIGRLAYAEVLTLLILRLHGWGCLAYLRYDLKGPIVQESDLPGEDSGVAGEWQIPGDRDLLALEGRLEEWKRRRVVYKELSLHNGNKLLNRQITWTDAKDGSPLRLGPDLLSSPDGNEMLWAGELKGGADPAGSDEHWKTATQAFNRILLACVKTGRSQPPLSFIATILVERVAREAAQWIADGKLTSVYNLTQIADNPAQQEAFLNDLARFLNCARPEGV